MWLAAGNARPTTLLPRCLGFGGRRIDGTRIDTVFVYERPSAPVPFDDSNGMTKTCPIGTDVARAAAIICDGGLVAIPTETVYGLAANALDARSVARIFEAKGRPWFDPLIVHIAELAWVSRVAREFPAEAERLAARFWPGPLSLVLPRTEAVPDLVTSGLPDVAVRVPDHPLTRELLRAANLSLAAPSANLFGRLSPTTAEHVREQLGDRIDYILDGGPCRVGVESTVLKVGQGPPQLLRPGGVPLEEIEALIGAVQILPPTDDPGGRSDEHGYSDEQSRNDEHGRDAPQTAPGRLPQHYAPRTPLRLLPVAIVPGQRVGLLAFQNRELFGNYAGVEVLSMTGDLREAATNFFGALRRLDAAGLDLIVAEPLPETGLGRALNDRLRRASTSATAHQ